MKPRQLLPLTLASLCGFGILAADPAGGLPPLTTASSNPRLPGKFVWVDLVTDDVPAARKFYSSLFGWTFRNVDNYTIAANDERPLCGMFQRQRPADRPGAKPRWLGYISVSSVSRAQRAVIKGGGEILAEPMKYPQRGEQAVFADPDGALFGVVKSSSGDPEDFLPDPGDWIWIQLFSRDGRQAAEFYRNVAGYKIVENKTEDRLSDYVLTSGGFARGTVATLPKEHDSVHPTWLPFVRVESVKETAAQVAGLGGKLLIAPDDNLLRGGLAVIADPTGASLGIMEWSQNDMKAGH